MWRRAGARQACVCVSLQSWTHVRLRMLRARLIASWPLELQLPPPHSHPDLSNLRCHRGALGTAHVYALGDLLVAARAKHGSPEGLVRHGAAKVAKAEQRKRSAEGKVDQRRRALAQALEPLGGQLRWGPGRVGSYMALGAGFLTHAARCACCAVRPTCVSHFPCRCMCACGSGTSAPPQVTGRPAPHAVAALHALRAPPPPPLRTAVTSCAR